MNIRYQIRRAGVNEWVPSKRDLDKWILGWEPFVNEEGERLEFLTKEEAEEWLHAWRKNHEQAYS